MTADTPQVFTGITQAQYAKLIEKARAAGMVINGNNGRASRMGVELEWNYCEENRNWSSPVSRHRSSSVLRTSMQSSTHS